MHSTVKFFIKKKIDPPRISKSAEKSHACFFFFFYKDLPSLVCHVSKLLHCIHYIWISWQNKINKAKLKTYETDRQLPPPPPPLWFFFLLVSSAVGHGHDNTSTPLWIFLSRKKKKKKNVSESPPLPEQRFQGWRKIVGLARHFVPLSKHPGAAPADRY